MTTVAVAPLRRWVRRTQLAHMDGGETALTFYVILLSIAILGGIFFDRLRAIFWPVAPDASGLAGASLVLVVLGLLHLGLRRLGPLAISRPAASWLLTAPISRRRLLWPSLWVATLLAAGFGTVSGLAILGHAGPRPVPGALIAAGALGGVGVLLLALAAQGGRRWAAPVDTVVALLTAAGFAGLVVDAATGAPPLTAWPATWWVTPAAIVLAAFFLQAVRGLARTPDDRILEASRTAGTLADSAFGVEPSFVVDMVERQYWARRRLRSRPLIARLPVLAAQDLRLALRRPRRLLWLAGATALPALFAHFPPWVLAVAVLTGALLAGGTTAASVRTDAANPVLLRMLALSSRRAMTQRHLVPAVLAAAWSAISLEILHIMAILPAGPWWAMGLAVGPVGAVAALRRARLGFVDNSLLPLETPMGTISTGPALASIIGYDALLLGIPLIAATAAATPLSWTTVLIQAVLSAAGARAYLAYTTAPTRVDLSKP